MIRSKNLIKSIAMLGAALMLVAPMAYAQTGAVGTAQKANHQTYEGTVASMTPTGFTMTTRYGDQTVTVNTSDSTQYSKTSAVPIGELPVGQWVTIGGKIDATTSTVTARAIMVDATAPKPNAKAGGRAIKAQIATTTPNLTVTTADNQTYTVQTTPRTIVLSTAPGTSSDVAVGTNVRVIGEGSGDVSSANLSVNARRVDVVGAFGQRRAGVTRHKKAAAV